MSNRRVDGWFERKRTRLTPGRCPQAFCTACRVAVVPSLSWTTISPPNGATDRLWLHEEMATTAAIAASRLAHTSERNPGLVLSGDCCGRPDRPLSRGRHYSMI